MSQSSDDDHPCCPMRCSLILFSLVDLGEENDKTLKMPSQIAAEQAAAGGVETVESAEKTATQMAEQAGEKNIKVNLSISRRLVLLDTNFFVFLLE